MKDESFNFKNLSTFYNMIAILLKDFVENIDKKI
jgi:hypothetical protein